MELDGVIEFFNEHARQAARPSEEIAFEGLFKTAQRSIDRDDNNFEGYLNEARSKISVVLFRQDWFIVGWFKSMSSSPHHFSDPGEFEKLVSMGVSYLQKDDIDGLREIIGQLSMIKIDTGSDTDMLEMANIIRS